MTDTTVTDDDPIVKDSALEEAPSTKAPLESPADAKIREAVKEMKEKLDRAYGERDKLAASLAAKEQKERELEIERLKEAGKSNEAYELQLTQERAEKEALKQRTIELTRDIELRDSLSVFTFKNENARKLAQQEIVKDLVQDEKGEWLHKSGISITDYAQAFSENPANEFLFKAKTNSGTGDLSTTSTQITSSDNKSLFDLSQEEVLARARKGNIRRRSN